MAGAVVVDSARERGLQDYRKKLLEHKEVESRLKESKLRLSCLQKCLLILKISLFIFCLVREQLKELTKQFDKSENDLKALQSVGQIVGEVLKQLTEDKCKLGLDPCF